MYENYIKHICAFANSEGGNICIGLNKDGEVIGIDDASLVVKEIDKVNRIIGVNANCTIRNKDGKDYILVQIAKSDNIVLYEGKYYTRLGFTTHEATKEELQRKILDSMNTIWDAMPEENVTLGDIDDYAVIKNYKRMLELNQTFKVDVIDKASILKKLDLYDGVNLTKAGVLLFAFKPNRFITNSNIKICLFDNEKKFISETEINGPVISQVDETIEFLYNNDITPVNPEILSQESLKEMLYNALQYKLYYSNKSIYINVYSDKLEIWNPSDTDTKSLHNTINPNISRIFKQCGYVKLIGMGLKNIKNECEKNKIGNPIIEKISSGYQITYRFTKLEDNSNKVKVVTVTNKKELSSVKRNALMVVLENMQKNNKITSKELASKMNKDDRTIKRYIAQLKKEGYIQRVGSDKVGNWQVLRTL